MPDLSQTTDAPAGDSLSIDFSDGKRKDFAGVDTRIGEIVPFGRELGLRGRVLRMGWELPPDLPEEDWREAGTFLGKIERSWPWLVGDWWRYGERYGRRAEIVLADDWNGPRHQTCRNVAVVCEAFDVSRRRDTLGFSHHAEVAALSPAEADALLDWAEEPIATTGKPRSTRELRREVGKLRAAAASKFGADPERPPADAPPVVTEYDMKLVGAEPGEAVASTLSDGQTVAVAAVGEEQGSAARAEGHRAIVAEAAIPDAPKLKEGAEKDCAISRQATLPGLELSLPATEHPAAAARRRTASGRAGKAWYRAERELIAYLGALGVRAEQVPLSDRPAQLLSVAARNDERHDAQ